MATINIGNLSFTHKGDYAGGTAYVKNDIVYYATNGNSYIAKVSTTGNVPTSTAHWDLFVAGSSGIWNAGLSLGSANQVVAVNSGGSALEFQNVSSDFVKIGTTTLTGNTANVYFSDVFTSDYTTYKLFIDGMYGASNTYFNIRFTTTGTNEISSGYYMAGSFTYYRYSDNSTTNVSHRRHHNDSVFRVLEETGGSSAVHPTTSEFTFFNPRVSGEYKTAMWRTLIRSSNNYHYTAEQYGYVADNSNAMNGIRIFAQSGDMAGGRFTLYGIK